MHLKFSINFLVISFIIIAICPYSLWINVYQALKVNTLYKTVRSSTLYVLAQNIFHLRKESTIFTLPFCSNPNIEYSHEYKYLQELVRLHRYHPERSRIFRKVSKLDVDMVKKREAQSSLILALKHQSAGRSIMALKLLKHAASLDPDNAVILTALGEAFENVWTSEKAVNITNINKSDILIPERLKYITQDSLVTAEQLYAQALVRDPNYNRAITNQQRTLPLVEKIDQERLQKIDLKLLQFYGVPDSNPSLRLVKIEHYFQHIYHSNAIEGNTLSLAQTRAVLETRIAVGGKSLQEQNEVLGLDAAFRYLNTTLLRGSSIPIELSDLLELHRRLLSFVDLTEAGRFRVTQVFIAEHTPPPPHILPQLMQELMDWINSDVAEQLHPIEMAALAHWKLVYIHPFYDGNGRSARLLMNLLLMRSGFPPAIIRKEDRHLYYETLKLANMGDVRPFIRFITDCSERTIDEYLFAAFGSSLTDSMHLRQSSSPVETSVSQNINKQLSGPLMQFAPSLNYIWLSHRGTEGDWKAQQTEASRSDLSSATEGVRKKSGEESPLPDVIYTD